MALSVPAMSNTTGYILAVGTAATVVAAAPPSDPPGFVLYVILGVLAGTIWRARYWFDEEGFHRKECISDLTSILALIVGGFGVCEYFGLSGWTAGTVAVFVSVLGVEPIRNAAIPIIDALLRLWASRLKPPKSGGDL